MGFFKEMMQHPEDRLTEHRVDAMRERKLADAVASLINGHPDFYWSPVKVARRWHGNVRLEFANGESFDLVVASNRTGKDDEPSE